MLRFLSVLLLVSVLVHAGLAQAPQNVYLEVHYHKLKPGHTVNEAIPIENEWKKLHQAQVNDGFLLAWYVLALDLTTNPNKEYSYITVKAFSDAGYLDNNYPQKYFTSVMGTDYRTKIADLSKRTDEIKELVKVEYWEQLESAAVNPVPAPYKDPVWVINTSKIKNGQYEEYTAQVKKLKPYSQERLNSGDGATWTVSGLMLPWSAEKPYDFATVITFPSMKALVDSYDSSGEAAFKKAMPGVDQKQFMKQFDNLREMARQEIYYLVDYAVKAPASTVRLDTKQFDSYVGVYEGPFNGNPKAIFTITREGDQLFEELTGGRKLEIIPRSETHFVFDRMDAELEFVRDASGKVAKRTLTYGGQTSEAKKIK